MFTRVLSGSPDAATGGRGGDPGEEGVAPLERAPVGGVEGGGVEGVEVEGVEVEGVEVEGVGVEGDAEVGDLAGVASTGSPDAGAAVPGLFG